MKYQSARSETSTLLGSTALYCAGSLIFSFMPVYLGDVGRRLHLSSAALGVLSAAELWSIAIASLTGPLWINRFNWRLLARIGAVTSIFGQLGSLALTDFNLLLIARIITGLGGEGVLFALSYSLIAKTRNVERSLGVAYAMSIAGGTICLYASPEMDRALGSISVLAALAVLSGVSLVVSFVVPINSGGSAPDDTYRAMTASSTTWRARAALALVGQMIWYAGVGGFWSFTEQVAADNAISSTRIAQAMGIGTAAALIGTILAAGMSNRFGRAFPIVLSTILIGGAIFGFTSSSEFVSITVELALFNIFWACGNIYITATACSFDTRGTIAVLLPASPMIGMALGTFVLGNCIRDLGIGTTPWIAGGFLANGMFLVLLSTFMRKHDLAPNVVKALESD